MSVITFPMTLMMLRPVTMLKMSSCCTNIVINVEDPESDIHLMQGARLGFYTQTGFYGARPQYKQDGGKYIVFFSSEEREWLNTEYHSGNTSAGLANIATTYCVDSDHPWVFWNGSSWIPSRKVITKCASIKSSCCSSVELSTSNMHDTELYTSETKDFLGVYTAVGVSNGRYVYQKLGYDGYLEYTDNGDWMVTDMMGTNTGYLSHLGGSVCPEHSSSNWDVLRYNETFTQWNHDISLNVKCVQDIKESQESPRAGSGYRTGLTGDKNIPAGSSDGSAAIIVLAVLCLIMIVALGAIFGTKFRRAWSQGAHGGQLIRESFRIN